MGHDTLNKQDTDFTRLIGAPSLPTMEKSGTPHATVSGEVRGIFYPPQTLGS